MVNNEYMQMMNEYVHACKPAVCKLLTDLAKAWGMSSTIYTLRTPYQEYGWYIESNHIGVVIAVNCENPQKYYDPESWELMLGKPWHHSTQGLGQQSYLANFPVTEDGVESIVAYINEWGYQHFSI
jgi:hypothetical protein